jgi:ADP-ribosyl-[dinitrogen reductase] hydrolase
MMDTFTDPSKFEGCLLGLAIGDALGMPFEGWRPPWILSHLGGKVKDFLPSPKRHLNRGQWTDDTKMALYLLRSILRGGGRVDPEDVARSYVEWFESGDLRGIGQTTLDAIMRLRAGTPWDRSGRTGEYAAGNGTAMRTAPIGLLHCLRPDDMKRDSCIDAIITHNNPDAISGSLAVNFFVSRGVRQADFVEAKPTLINECIQFIGPGKVADNLARARDLLLDDSMRCSTALQILGTGGHVVETVASAVFCFLKTPDNFEESIINAVMGGSDTDTTAAVAGAISGAWNGTWNIPRKWVSAVEGSEEFRSLAGQLFNFSGATP